MLLKASIFAAGKRDFFGVSEGTEVTNCVWPGNFAKILSKPCDQSRENERHKSSLQEQNSESIRVYLRIRPQNKLEESLRSHNCIKVMEGAQECYVDTFSNVEQKFSFDKVSDFVTPWLSGNHDFIPTMPA